MDSIRSKGWGIAAGIAVHLLFAVTVWALFWFLKGSRHGGMHGSLLMDACLALMFCVPHSLLLHPVVRRRLTQVIPGAFYGLFFTAVTCVSLLVLFALWQTVGPVLWEAKGGFRVLVDAGFYLSWAALFYSLYLTGLGYQTGLTPWLAW
ncbi:MAG: hypothetical protein KDA37_15275, partial [Planctomycetales bacterium]|nr:hypothetical protein [Planctomycetales bacterium]